MSDKVIDYLELNREIVINIDVNELVDSAIKAWKFMKNDFKQQCGKELTTPEVLFNTNEIEYLQVDMDWDNDKHHLDIEIIDGGSNAYVYYRDKINRTGLDRWYTLNTPLPDWLLDKLSLFTN